MTFAEFDSGKKPLEDLLRAAREGSLQLPDFQRGWVWDDAGIRSLLASISQSFPVGALMTLQTGGDIRFKPRPIEGVDPKTAGRPELLLLDGQQRITSLYQACFQDGVIGTLNAQRRPIRRWYYIDMARALDADEDREDAIIGMPEERVRTADFGRTLLVDLRSRESEYALGMFPTNRVFKSDEWQMGFFRHWQFDQEKIKFWMEFANRVLAAFKHYQVPVITLGKSTPKEAVCLVFEKVNMGGRKLDAFELLTAIYAAEDFDLRKDWLGDPEHPDPRHAARVGRYRRLAREGVLHEIANVDFLQAVSLLHTYDKRLAEQARGKQGKELTPVSCTRAAVLDLPREAYARWAEPLTEGFLRAAKLLRLLKIFRRKDLPYATQLVPLAAVLTRIGEARWERQVVRDKLARWYWCGVFGELYGSAVETRFAKDLVENVAWLEDGPEPTTVREASFAADRLSTLRSRLSAAYKGVHALLMVEGARDLRSGQPFEQSVYSDERVDIHHVFPKVWCERRGLAPGRTDSIVNKSPLSARTNRIIGGEAPSRYLPRIAKDAGVDEATVDATLASHGIAATHLRADDFEAFFEARANALLLLIGRAMGTSVTRASAFAEPEGEPLDEGDEAGEETIAAAA